jgi:uncharacterized protein (TIGR02646 family)
VIRIRRSKAADVLSTAARSYLAKKATTALAFPPGDPRIESVWKTFGKTKARDLVKEALDTYMWRKCVDCEVIAAKDIEHFYPKAKYPDRMFSWENFLLGCKNCNNAKVAHFPLDGAGNHLLIDPCADEPLDYFVWDFESGATGLAPAPRDSRALATREMFHLDDEPLREERRVKVKIVLYLLARVIDEDPVSVATRERLREELDPRRPWLCMVRQLFLRPDEKHKPIVDRAIAKLPDIHVWVADWL